MGTNEICSSCQDKEYKTIREVTKFCFLLDDFLAKI